MQLKNNYKSLIIRLKLYSTLTIASHTAYGQFFDGGQNPPSVKFNQINTPHFQIIFPSEEEKKAQIVANTLEHVINQVSYSLNHSPRPISIILQSKTVEANGFVQTAPRRSELYTIPSQEFDFQDWLKSLIIHELRHVVQFDKVIPHLEAPLFEELKLALFGINLPPWFFEGDAVITETLLTQAGRGRQPSFDLNLRANLLSGRNYSYSKNYLGSYKNFTPDYYTLGYFMTSKLRKDFGSEILDQSLNRIAKFPLRPYNFSSSIKKFGGYGTHQLYKKTTMEIDSFWQDQLSKTEHRNYTPINNISSKKPSNYLLPIQTENGDILCLKTALSTPTQIITINNHKEKKIVSIGPQLESHFHYANQMLTWDEFRYDKRYSKQNFSEVCIYDFYTKTKKTLTKNTRSFSPSLSPDGKKIVFVAVDKNGSFNLKEIDSRTGNTISVLPNEEGYTLQTPRYREDGEKIVVTAVNNMGKTFLVYDVHTKKHQKIFKEERQLLARPVFWNNGILYKAHYDGIENIFYFDFNTQQRKKITYASFGGYNANLTTNKDEILFNDYQADGFNISTSKITPSEATFETKTTKDTHPYLNSLKTQENSHDVLSHIPEVNYPVKKYRDLTHLFYFHSLRPVFEDDNQSRIGFNMVSDNKLNTLSTTIGYAYNTSLNSNEFDAQLNYKKYYPIFSFGVSNKENISYAKGGNQTNPIWIPFYWRENKTSLQIEIPFQKNWNNKFIKTSYVVNTSYSTRSNPSIALQNFKQNFVFPMQYQWYGSFSTLRSQRDLAPRYAASFAVNYQHYPFDKKVNGEFFYLKTAGFLPGLLENHSLQVRYNYQHSSGSFAYNANIPRARGYTHLLPIGKLNNTLLLDYKLPLAYPDWEIGPLAYVKRLRGGAFTDFENLEQAGNFKSFGLTFGMDMNLLRYYLPNFALDSKFIIPAQGNNSQKPIVEIGLTFNY
ncbi:TolB family protein [Pseudopedobacter beijingensis]|uniref:TolB family protein n=1 Tax=Pseudopedobacter beijingensis TaxID=1207056 RepID=A0ABW4ID77_9SPHI